MKSATSKPLRRSSRWFVPLYLKVLLVFLLNVLVVTVGIFWLLRSVFELDRHLLVDPGSVRVRKLIAESPGMWDFCKGCKIGCPYEVSAYRNSPLTAIRSAIDFLQVN